MLDGRCTRHRGKITYYLSYRTNLIDQVFLLIHMREIMRAVNPKTQALCGWENVLSFDAHAADAGWLHMSMYVCLFSDNAEALYQLRRTDSLPPFPPRQKFTTGAKLLTTIGVSEQIHGAPAEDYDGLKNGSLQSGLRCQTPITHNSVCLHGSRGKNILVFSVRRNTAEQRRNAISRAEHPNSPKNTYHSDHFFGR